MRRVFHRSGWLDSRAWMLGMALFAAGSCKQIESRDLIREGNTAYADGQYAEAIEAYTKSIDIEEDGVKVFWNRGCAAMSLVLKLKGTSDPEKLEQRKAYTNMALKDFQTWLDRADEEEQAAEEAEAAAEAEEDGAPVADDEDKRSNEEIVLDYRLTLLDADERCDDLLQYWMDKHKAEPREENWYNVIGRQYEKCGQPDKRVEWMKKRAADFPDSVKAWHALAVLEFEPLWPDPETGLSYNEDLSPSDRIKTADKVVELLDKATALDPQFLDAYTWRSMAYTQRMFARTVTEEPEMPEERLEAILAREDSMLAWKNQKAKCDLEGTKECPADLSTLEEGQSCCPAAPLSTAEQAEDAAAKKEVLAEMAQADAEAAEPPKKKRRRRKK